MTPRRKEGAEHPTQLEHGSPVEEGVPGGKFDEDYRVRVGTDRFDEAGAAAFLLERMAGRQVQLPGSRDCWLDKMHLAWHRQYKLDARRKLRARTNVR